VYEMSAAKEIMIVLHSQEHSLNASKEPSATGQETQFEHL
jgi:hypothetical protein